MTQAIIKLGEKENRIINIVKAQHGLSNKSEAVNLIIDKFEEELMEPELRPEFIERALKIDKEKSIHIGSIEDFRKRYEK